MSSSSERLASSPDALKSRYLRLRETPTDVNEHMPLLCRLAAQCGHVTEFGVRGGNSTTALLMGQPDRLVCYDVVKYAEVEALEGMPGRTAFEFRRADVLAADIEETDLLFVDTWHVYEQLRAELKKHAAKVRRWVVLHDTTSYGERGETPGHRGLWPAVEEFLARGTFELRRRCENNNGLTVLERVAPESAAVSTETYPLAKVYIGVPWYGGFPGQVLDKHEVDSALDPHSGDEAVKFSEGGSFHCRNFNNLWASALNTRFLGWSHFCMIHQDVRPEGYWLSTMLDELRRHKADVLSVVLPIKSHHGLTSTALHDPATGRVRRLTMKEVSALPCDTFDAAAAGFPGWDLLLSSGLWVCDFSKPWVEDVWFEVRDRIVKGPDGIFKTETVSEDWAFSHVLHKLGLEVLATRLVPAGHWGVQEFRNDCAWGSWDKDEEKQGAFGSWYSWPQPGSTNN